MKPLKAATSFVLLTALLILASCSKTFYAVHQDVYQKYIKLPQPKALAVAEDYNGAFAYGYSYRGKNIDQVKKDALFQCKARKELYDVKDDCKIYMINNKKITEK